MSLVTPGLAREYEHTLGRRWAPPGPTRAAALMVLRNFLVFRRAWHYFITGFAEPVFYLLSIGIGVGVMVPDFEVAGEPVAYAAFVAPAMLAASAMNGAVQDATFNIFFKLKYEKVYDAVLATPMRTTDVARGEITWALMRGAVYSVVFLLIMLATGLVSSWWALLALPAAVLIAFAFAAVGMALTTFMRSWQDFDYVTLAIIPMLLLSATFFPVTVYPEAARWVVEATPLYRGVVLCRELTTGLLTLGSLVSVLYLAAMGAAGLAVARRRLERLLLS